ncbi:MAG: hypothetical protein EXR98_03630 [Gemmataceae bacterium]|nr:hypothetical protein [Gemmataceae bacterium]
MQSTHLACPHCGSTLSFGMEIAAGTPVECLICMQTFTAETVVVETTPDRAVEPQPVIGSASVSAPNPPELVASNIDDAGCTTISDTVTDSLPNVAPSPPAVEPIAASLPNLVIVESAPSSKPAKTPPKDGILVSKPYAPPPNVAIAEKCLPAVPAAERATPASLSVPTAPSLRKPDGVGFAGPMALVAAGLCLLLLLVGGVGVAAWKIAALAQAGPADSKDKIVVNNKKPSQDGGNDKTDPNDNGIVPELTEEEEEDIRVKFQLEVRDRLTRSTAAKGGGVPAWDPVASFGVSKQKIVGLDQERINAAIDKGVKYLKRTQNANGTWYQGHGVGYASIGGLTLLECGVPKNKDMNVQRAAQYVRDHCTNLGSTYELSLAILFLDRLGYERDRPLIQGMALRLMAGQNDGGGWSYGCPPISSQDMFQLYAFLQSNKQLNLLNPLGKSKTASGIALNPVRDPNGKLNDPFHEFNDLILTMGVRGANTKPAGDPKKGGVIQPVYTDAKKSTDGEAKSLAKPIRPETLSHNLQNLPVVKNQGVTKKLLPKGRHGAGDNSNTQFAILALWAARRHDVPTDQALLAAYQRFQISQRPDGGWGYVPGSGTTHTMTNVGLLGHAMGHGVAPDVVQFNPKNPKDVIVKPALEDPSIQKGLQALARYIGQPSLDEKKTTFPMENLYFLWSVERVAMLYDLKTIGGKDWYGWGAQILVHNQNNGGEWPTSHYPGASPPLNTCFALLFLRRSNLVQDLTNNLRLDTGIRDP